MGRDLTERIVYLQARYSRLFMERHNLTTTNFLKLDAKNGILAYLHDGYESFHLTGDEGVLEELDLHVFGSSSIEFSSIEFSGSSIFT